MPAFAQRRVHSGKETTFGTAVAATAILNGVESITPKFDAATRKQVKYLDGTLNPANALIQTGEGGGFSMNQVFTFEDNMSVFTSALLSTTPTAGPPKVWTFPFPYASAPTLQTRTFEFYDGTGTSYRADSSLCKSFTLAAQAGQLELNVMMPIIAHNLFVLFKHSALGEGWQRHQVATVRWRLFHLPGKLVRHAGAWVLKIAHENLDLFHRIRARSFACAMANPSP
jgi:hypothetical protein